MEHNLCRRKNAVKKCWDETKGFPIPNMSTRSISGNYSQIHRKSASIGYNFVIFAIDTSDKIYKLVTGLEGDNRIGIMAIYTGHGDMGETSLVTGRRVKKNDPRVEAYGDVDELISYLAVLRCNVPPAFSDTLRRIQSNLMNVAAWLACDSELPKMKPLDAHEVKFLESEIDWMTESLPQLSCFTLPSPPISSAGCNFARTICRRCERRVVAIEEKTDQDSLSIIYLNRLSDYLFTLARYLCVTAGAVEDKWIP